MIVDDSKSNVTNMRSHLDSLISSVKYEVRWLTIKPWIIF
jgi:hypothetical protein